MTALPDNDAATSFDLNALFSNKRRMASATAAPSMIAPSTMLSGGTGSVPKAETRKAPLPEGVSSTALTALDPMSRPTTALDFLVRPNTCDVLFLCFAACRRPPHGQSRYQLPPGELGSDSGDR